ncbi:MAG: glycosyltransferase family 4 protein [Patescibacteria group bacterium]
MGQKIKLVQIIADSKIGGGSSHILGVLRNIDKEKFDCYLICPKGFLSDEAEKIPGLKIFNIEMKSKFDFGSIFQLKKKILEIRSGSDPFGPMIAHSHGPRAGLLSRFALPLGVKSVYTEHIYDETYRLKNPVNNAVQRFFLRKQNANTDLIIAVSNSVKNALVKHGLALPDQIIVIPNGVDVDKFKSLKSPAQKYNHPVIGSVGRLSPIKGFEYLIAAMPYIKKKFPLVSLEIIGSGSEGRKLAGKIRELKLEHNVTLLGSKEDPFKYAKHWNGFVIPSVSEPFGIVALEAMASGIPIVASKTGGLQDIITNKKNGLLVEPRNPEALAKVILQLLGNLAFATKLKREGQIRVKDFDWKKVVKELEKAYFNLFTE